MIRRLFSAALSRFSRRYAYDVTYLETMLTEDVGGFVRFTMTNGFMAHRFGLDPLVYFAAKHRAAQWAGCGPCASLVLSLAREAGVDPDRFAEDADARLASDYADAVLGRSADLLEQSETVRARFGERGRMGLAAAIVAGQFYPLMKRGMGIEDACLLPQSDREAA